MNRFKKKILFLILLSGFLMYSNTYAQKGKKDTVSTKTKEVTKNQVDSVSKELILEEINIKGEIDRPNVIIMPKRIETDIKKIDLERKFSEEINKANRDIIELKEELRKIESIESIKKTIKRKRLKKNNNLKEKQKKEKK